MQIEGSNVFQSAVRDLCVFESAYSCKKRAFDRKDIGNAAPNTEGITNSDIPDTGIAAGSTSRSPSDTLHKHSAVTNALC